MSKVSIIVPAYNLANYIEKCILSVLGQSYSNFELVIIDDGSTDKTWEVIQKFITKDDRIIGISQKNGGAARARNAGLDYITGDYVMFLDGDDLLTPSAIEDNIKYLENDISLDWVAFSIRRADERGNVCNLNKNIYADFLIKDFEVVSKEQFVPYYYERKLSGVCCGAIYRAKSIKNIRFPNGEFYEDGFFFIDLLCNTTRALKSPLGAYIYVDRENSSQLKPLDYCHLRSDMHCMAYRMLRYRACFPQYEYLYSKQESCCYYFYKIEQAKNLYDTKDIISEYKKAMQSKLQIDLRKELKILIYKILGYKNLVKIYNTFKKYN